MYSNFGMILVIILLFHLFAFCNLKEKEDYSRYFSYDTTIVLEEKDYIIINEITDIDIWGNSFVLTDGHSYNVIVYDFSGNILFHRSPNIYLSDSVAQKSKPYNKDQRYIDSEEFKKYYNNESSLISYSQTLSNRFDEAFFLDSNIIFITSVLGVLKQKKTDEPHVFSVLGTVGAFIKQNILTNSSEVFTYDFTPDLITKTSEYGFTQTGSTKPTNVSNRIVMKVSHPELRREAEKTLEPYWILVDYNYVDQVFNPIFKMPKEYIAINFFHGNDPEIIMIDDNYFVVHPLLPIIYDTKNETSFRMQNVSEINEDYFQHLNDNADKPDTLNMGFSELLEKTDLYIYDLKSTENNSLLVFFTAREDIQSKIKKYVVQEYSLKGELIHEQKFNEDFEHGTIEYLSYSNHYNALLIFSVDDQNWYLTTRKWNHEK